MTEVTIGVTEETIAVWLATEVGTWIWPSVIWVIGWRPVLAVAGIDAGLEVVGSRLADLEDTKPVLEIPNCVEY